MAIDKPIIGQTGWGPVLNAALDQLDSQIGSSVLLVVTGGTVDLDNFQPNGYLIGYRVLATTIIEGDSFPPGAYIFERDTSVASGWNYRTLAVGNAVIAAGLDGTPPIAGTLAASSVAETTFTLTVTGASDTGALHATPYGFSTDNGITYSAYQASAAYAVTGRGVSTAYTCKHRVRDAAGNITVGTAITVTTTELELHTIFDQMTGTNGTLLTSHAPDTGGAWTKPTGVGVLTLNGAGKAVLSGADGGFTKWVQASTTGTDGTSAIDITYPTTGDLEVGPTLRISGIDKHIYFGYVAAGQVGIVSFAPAFAYIGTNVGVSLPAGESLRLILSILGTTVTAKVKRLSDNTWLNTSGAWVASETHCITGTYATSWTGSPGIIAAVAASNGSTIDRFHYDA